MMNYGQKKEYVYNRLKQLAGAKQPITYGQLLREMDIDPRESWEKNRHQELRDIIGKISSEEYEKGNPLLSALVVHEEDRLPGEGFFVGLLEQIGKKPIHNRDKQLAFWVKEVKAIYEKWKPGK
jgi:hypothetical protein